MAERIKVLLELILNLNEPKNSDLKIVNSFDENSLNNNLKLIRELIKKND